jgi:4-carboxymuconolactone decarboxylase
MAPRIPPLPHREWTDEELEVIGFWEGEGARTTGAKSTLTMTLAQHPAMANAFYPFGKQLLVHSTLPARQRELLTLRISWLYGCEYEWGHHLQWARNLGVSDEEIESLKQDTGAFPWPELDRAVLTALDQLRERNRIDDDVWTVLARHFDTRQLMDLVLTIGHYVMLSWAISAWGTELEPGWPASFSLGNSPRSKIDFKATEGQAG